MVFQSYTCEPDLLLGQESYKRTVRHLSNSELRFLACPGTHFQEDGLLVAYLYKLPADTPKWWERELVPTT